MDAKICQRCGIEFLPRFRVTAAYWAKRRFCSHACAHAGNKGQRRSSFGKERVPLAERFWSKVNKKGPWPHCRELGRCWAWTGARQPAGYGYLGNRRKPNVKAHRLSWELHNGPIIGKQCVLHHCDNPPCVNPAHLYLGTNVENMADKVARGRQPDHHGENNPNAVLTAKKVATVRLLRAKGWSQQEIADEVGVGQTQIGKILRGIAWIEA